MVATQARARTAAGPCDSHPLSNKRFCSPSLPRGKTALTPAFDPGAPSACPGRVRPGLGWEPRLQDQPPGSARRAQHVLPGAARARRSRSDVYNVNNGTVTEGLGSQSEHTTPAAAHVFDR